MIAAENVTNRLQKATEGLQKNRSGAREEERRQEGPGGSYFKVNVVVAN